MFTVGQLQADLILDKGKFSAGLRDAKKEGANLSRDINKQMDKISRSAMRAGKSMTTFITVPLVGVGGALIKTASDAEETESKFDAVFKEMSGSTRDWAEQTARSTNRSKFALQGYLATLQDTFVPMGIARDEAAEMSKEVSKLAIDLASFNNIAEEDAVNNLTSALVGNHRAVRQFGININQASLEQELLNMGIEGGIQVASEQEKMMARMNIILGATADAQGDAERTAGSFANQMRGLKAATEELMVTFGNDLLPMATDIVGSTTDMVRGFSDMDEETRGLILRIGGIAVVVGPALIAFASLTKAVNVLKTASMGHPIGAIATAVATLGAMGFMQKKKIDGLRDSVKDLLDQGADSENIDEVGQKIGRMVNEIDAIDKASFSLFGKDFESDKLKEMRGELGDLQALYSEILQKNNEDTLTNPNEPELLDRTKKSLIGLADESESFLSALRRSGKPIEEHIAPQSSIIAMDSLSERYENFSRIVGGVSFEEFKELPNSMEDMNTIMTEIDENTSLWGDRMEVTPEKVEGISGAMMFANSVSTKFTDSFGEGMANVIVQAESLQDTLKNIGKLLLSSAIQTGIKLLLSGGGSGTGFLGSGGLFGMITGRASGGGINSGQTYMTGENGAELVSPTRSGIVTPKNMMGGGASASSIGMAFERALDRKLSKLGADEIYALSQRGRVNY